MPTGYTAILDERDVTLREFVLRCARAFGATVHQREESLDIPPQESTASEYYAEKLKEAQERLAQLQAMTIEEAAAECETAYQEQMEAWARRRAEWEKVSGRYAAMRLAIEEKWTPPTPDHAQLKDFMLEQLGAGFPYEPPREPPERCSPERWLATQIGGAQHDITYYGEKGANAEERTASANTWIRDLYKSVESL
jgi:hypothetical protein